MTLTRDVVTGEYVEKYYEGQYDRDRGRFVERLIWAKRLPKVPWTVRLFLRSRDWYYRKRRWWLFGN